MSIVNQKAHRRNNRAHSHSSLLTTTFVKWKVVKFHVLCILDGTRRIAALQTENLNVNLLFAVRFLMKGFFGSCRNYKGLALQQFICLSLKIIYYRYDSFQPTRFKT